MFSSITEDHFLLNKPISPYVETGAYEALWAENSNASFKNISNTLYNNTFPSEYVDNDTAIKYAKLVWDRIESINLKKVGVRIKGTYDYAEGLYDAEHPLAMLYFQGVWDYIYHPRLVAVVGSRKVSEDGIKRTKKLVDYLVLKHKCAVVSGLAEGVDAVAHLRAIYLKAITIGVIGTPITSVYPKKHFNLQKYIAENFLLISQVPIEKYYRQDYRLNRFFFPERNITMSAITKATFIVEAGETSGSLVQARAALKQGRTLFILSSCFENKNITWPARFEKMGAIRVNDFKDIDIFFEKETNNG